MINRGKYKEFIIEKISSLKTEISFLTQKGLTDENLHCEYLIKNILNIIFNWNLINLNTIKSNYPSIDLGDFTNRIAIQITSTKTSEKVNGTLKKFFKYNLNNEFDKLYVFILKDKQVSYTITENQNQVMFFDKSEHIMDFSDILKQIDTVDEEILIKLYQLFKIEFDNKSNYIDDINQIVNKIRLFTKQQIEIQKRSSKYIPDIFVETSKIKELSRYFAVPKFYYRALDDIKLRAIENLNESFKDFDLDPVNFNIDVQKPLTTNIIRLNSIEISQRLNNLKEELDNKISKLKELKSALFKRKPIPRKAWQYSYASFYNTWFLEKSIKQFQILGKHILLITSVAGKGKTNFLCDFVENVLCRRNINTLFFTGSELNNIDFDKIGDYLITRTFKNHYFDSFKDFAYFYQKIFEMTGKYLIIIIDGINEVNKLDIFPEKLSNFTEELLTYNFVKIIYSCRTEFFSERFNCLLNFNFNEEINIFSDFNRESTEFEKDKLYYGYLKYFNIRVNNVSDRVYGQLTSDPLLLRIFCEAYSSKSKDDKNLIIPNLLNLNKEHIFEKYYQFKIKKFTPISEHPIPLRKIDKSFVKVIDKIIGWMLDDRIFSNIIIEELDLTNDEENMLSRMINEDMFLRRDLIQSSFSEFSLNFTYDEFRDFLIARNLINRFTDVDLLKAKLNEILKPEFPIFEGVRKFLFHISRKINNSNLIKLIQSYPWYDNLFINEIFQLDDRYINEDDLNKIESIFKSGNKTSRRFILELMHRPDEKLFPNLNIKSLIQYLSSLDEDDYHKIFGNLLYYNVGYDRMHYYDNIDISNLIKSLMEVIEKEESLNYKVLNYLETIVFTLGCSDYHLRDNSRMLLIKFMEKYPDEATSMFEKSTKNINIDCIKKEIQEILNPPDYVFSLTDIIGESE